MRRIVKIPSVGNVAFPDHMTDAEVAKAARRLHQASATEKWVRVHLSDGRDVEVHPDDLAELKKRDPKAAVQPTHYFDPNDKSIKEMK